jgi:hypothetical protein
MKTSLIALICIAFFLSSCSSSRSYTFVPKQGQNILWRNGESGVSDTAASLYCMVNSPVAKNEKIQFNMRFHNDGNETILIDPSTFYTCQSSENGTVQRSYPYTDDQLLAKYNQQVSSKTGLIIFAALAAVVVGAAVIAATSSSSSSTKTTETTQQKEEREHKEQLDRIERNQREQIELERSRQNFYSSPSSTESYQPSAEQLEMDSIHNNILRKHSLLPEESISGLVIFPLLYDARTLELHVPVKDSCNMKFSYDVLLK